MNENQCWKRRFHSNYISSKGIRRRKYLPGEFHNVKEIYELVDTMVVLTGLLVKKVTDPNSNATTIVGKGTGCVEKITRHVDGKCPCRNEKEHPRKEFATIRVTTVLGVFEDDKNTSNASQTDSSDVSESDHANGIRPHLNAQEVEVKLNYNRDETQLKSCPTLYGDSLLQAEDADYENDWCALDCATHDMVLVDKLERALLMYKTKLLELYKISKKETLPKRQLVIIVGHPHGLPKRVSVGTVLDRTILNNDNIHHLRWYRYTYKALTCPGSRGSPVYIFRQLLTRLGLLSEHPQNHSSCSGEDIFTGTSSVGVVEVTCDEHHDDYFTYNEFQTKEYFNILPVVFTTSDRQKLHTFLNRMSDLTGIILLKKKSVDKLLWKYYGTGFIAKIERRTHFPKEREPRNDQYAVVTISTAYHIFNEYEEGTTSFDAIDEIWNDMDTYFIPNYTNDDGSNASSVQNNVSDNDSTSSDGTELGHLDYSKALIGDRLIETDKDLEFENDWCAFECVVDDPELIEKLETLVKDYQNLMSELYKKSQEQMYKDVNLVVIFGHPHQLAKRMSVGKTRDFASAPKRKILKEVRSNQIWCRYSYDNATCVGSSGSPIFIWGQPVSGLGYWFGHPHNHSGYQPDEVEDVYIGKSTIGVEHIV
uniref:Peptidase S1 domain-containing protein n=1 Tax=Biomphalaria glabrata TaxID=6526 RepID=A0A2C9L362_BIOGL